MSEEILPYVAPEEQVEQLSTLVEELKQQLAMKEQVIRYYQEQNVRLQRIINNTDDWCGAEWYFNPDDHEEGWTDITEPLFDAGPGCICKVAGARETITRYGFYVPNRDEEEEKEPYLFFWADTDEEIERLFTEQSKIYLERTGKKLG